MKQQIAKIVLCLSGWKFEIHSDIVGIDKAIILAAPHTSEWDFVLGKLMYVAMGLNVKFLIAQEFFFFPLGILLKGLGAYPINRKNPRTVIELKQQIQVSKQFIITFCPEGTRKKTDNWGNGFYKLAIRAGIPIFLAYLDYGNKYCIVGKSFQMSGNFDHDMKQLKLFYRQDMAKYQQQFAFHQHKIVNCE